MEPEYDRISTWLTEGNGAALRGPRSESRKSPVAHTRGQGDRELGAAEGETTTLERRSQGDREVVEYWQTRAGVRSNDTR